MGFDFPMIQRIKYLWFSIAHLIFELVLMGIRKTERGGRGQNHRKQVEVKMGRKRKRERREKKEKLI